MLNFLRSLLFKTARGHRPSLTGALTGDGGRALNQGGRGHIPGVFSGAKGFTLIEMLVIVIIVGILSAIVAPSWLAFSTNQRLNSAQDRALQAMQDARRQAQRTRIPYAAIFRLRPGDSVPQWGVIPVPAVVDWSQVGPQYWNTFGQNNATLQIVTATSGTSGITTLPQPPTSQVAANTMWILIFNDKGCPVKDQTEACTQTGLLSTNSSLKITLAVKNGGASRRCVVVSTLLGGLRGAKNTDCN